MNTHDPRNYLPQSPEQLRETFGDLNAQLRNRPATILGWPLYLDSDMSPDHIDVVHDRKIIGWFRV